MNAGLIPFKELLNATVTPIVLISGVGLILVSCLNRYSQAAARTRLLIAERRNSQEPRRRDNLNRQIQHLIKRARILRTGIGCLVTSTIFSSLIIVVSLLQVAMDVLLPLGVVMALLLASCLCIALSNILLLVEVTLSLKALWIEIEYDQPPAGNL